jgi:hypothetical protein
MLSTIWDKWSISMSTYMHSGNNNLSPFNIFSIAFISVSIFHNWNFNLNFITNVMNLIDIGLLGVFSTPFHR